MVRAKALGKTVIFLAGLTFLSACSIGSESDPQQSPTLTSAANSTVTATQTPLESTTPTDSAVEGVPSPSSSETGGEPEDLPVAAVLSIVEMNTNGSLTVAGFVNGVSEDDGDCKFTASRGDTVLTQNQSGLSNVGTTACGSVTFAADSLTAGTWQVKLVYAGSQGAVRSEVASVEVP